MQQLETPPVGSLTISIDVELAWGMWDLITRKQLDLVAKYERPVVHRLFAILDRFEITATWAMVAALLDAREARDGPRDCWYFPELADLIASAKMRHDIASQGGRHRYFDRMSAAEAQDDLGYARAIHDKAGFAWGSFIFPRNLVSRRDLVQENAIRIYRGPDRGWQQTMRERALILGRMANLADNVLPTIPQTVVAERDGAMANLPGSLLLFGRDGLRRLAAPQIMRYKLRRGLDRAIEHKRCFHLWFHPCNFYHDTDRQFETLETILAHARNEADRGRLVIKTMADHVA